MQWPCTDKMTRTGSCQDTPDTVLADNERPAKRVVGRTLEGETKPTSMGSASSDKQQIAHVLPPLGFA